MTVANPSNAWADAEGTTWRLGRLGPAALRLAADAAPSADLSRRLATIRRRLWANRPAGLTDVVVGYRCLTLELRPGARERPSAAVLREITLAPDPDDAGRHGVVLPVDYGVEADVDALVARFGRPWRDIVATHAAARYVVAFLGFTPGFPYLHGLPAALALPRRTTPRDVPAGAVAIADGRGGVYPRAGPGGWWVLGTTRTELFDPWRASPALLAPGDEVRFAPTEDADAHGSGASPRAADRPPSDAEAPHGDDTALTVARVWPGGVTLQGRARTGVGHLGMAQAGALDAAVWTMATRLAGAPPSAPALEFAVPHADLVAEKPLTAAWAGGGGRLRLAGADVPMGRPFAWPAGVALEIRPDATVTGAVLMLAVGGGLVPVGGAAGHPDLVGAGSTDVRAGVGGFGRALVPGDALALAGAPRAPDLNWSGRLRFARQVALRLHPGPHGETTAYAALLTTGYRLAALDRMGARLAGPPVEPQRPDVPSEGVPLGAVQLPGDGQPIVLLADRGRTGGYAIVGVVDGRDLAALVQARPGAPIAFVPPTG